MLFVALIKRQITHKFQSFIGIAWLCLLKSNCLSLCWGTDINSAWENLLLTPQFRELIETDKICLQKTKILATKKQHHISWMQLNLFQNDERCLNTL